MFLEKMKLGISSKMNRGEVARPEKLRLSSGPLPVS